MRANTLQHLAVFPHLLSLSLCLSLVFLTRLSQEDVIENVHGTHQRMDGDGEERRGVGGGRDHQCMTRRLSLIGPPLWHLQTLAAVAEEEKDEEEEGEEEEEGGCNREFRDIGRRNDCRSCPFFSPFFPFFYCRKGVCRLQQIREALLLRQIKSGM